jgi:soluble lytic murein transglycosylase-like protein
MSPMTQVRWQFLVLLLAFGLCSGARADVYGFVDSLTGRVSILYTDRPPADSRYQLYRKDELGRSAPQPEASASGFRLKPSRYSSQIMAAAHETKVDPALIHAVITVESGYNPSARSRAGAVGLMQLMPETARRYGVTNRLDPSQNIHGGARYLRDLKAMFGNNLQLVIAAYNAGEEAVMKYGRRIPPYRETIAYVPKVMGHYNRLRVGMPPTARGG